MRKRGLKDEVDEREIKALIKADELNADILAVITWDCDDKIGVGGRKVVFTPLWEWISQSAG